ICTAMARRFAWGPTTSAMQISPNARFTCLTAVSSKKQRKPAYPHKGVREEGRSMGTIWQDIRYGLRMLVKHRLTTLVCIAALALGIGANTAMFSLAEAFLLHPVPFENANRLVALVDSHADANGASFG